MAYSNSRLRKTLAVARMLTGMVFISVGAFKVSSLEFARVLFPDFLENAIRGGGVGFIQPLLRWVVSVGPGRVAITIGFVELFIGIALLLGLAVRPAALFGMLYSAVLFLATFNQEPTVPSMLQSTEHQFRNLFPFLIFLVLGIGHAGETWGLGALYHHHRSKRWEEETAKVAALKAPAAETEEREAATAEPGFSDLMDEQTAEAEGIEDAWSSSPPQKV